MALHYLIDGYNLIRSVDWLMAGSLQDQRARLLRFIEEKKPQGSPRNTVSVIFDGQPDVTSPRHVGSVRVAFSEGPSADRILKALVDQAKSPADVVVVTNDKAIRRWARGAKAQFMSCEDFLAAARPATKTPGARQKVDVQAEAEINEELKQLWKLK